MLSMAEDNTGKELWTIIVPQASHNHPPVKHMLVALSMLDQYLAGSLPSLFVQGHFRLALQHYNNAIRALDFTSSGSSLACTVLVCMLAWMFELITNRPSAGAIHLTAAKNMVCQPQSFPKTLDVEDHFMIGYAKTIVQDEKLIYTRGFRRPEGHIVQMRDLNEARSRLADIVQVLLRSPDATGQSILSAQLELNEWRAAFEAYRYTGPEPLREKRSVFLAHNMVGTYFSLLLTSIADCKVEVQTGELVHRILDDVEHILEHEELGDVGWTLSLILRYISEQGEADCRAALQARRLEALLNSKKTCDDKSTACAKGFCSETDGKPP